jgi:hypothetical protein
VTRRIIAGLMNDETVVPSFVLFHSSFCAPNSTRWRATPCHRNGHR